MTNYINLHSLNGIIFIDPVQLKYVKSVGEETEFDKNRDKNNNNFDLPKEENKNSNNVCNLLAAYVYLDNDTAAK